MATDPEDSEFGALFDALRIDPATLSTEQIVAFTNLEERFMTLERQEIDGKDALEAIAAAATKPAGRPRRVSFVLDAHRPADGCELWVDREDAEWLDREAFPLLHEANSHAQAVAFVMRRVDPHPADGDVDDAHLVMQRRIETGERATYVYSVEIDRFVYEPGTDYRESFESRPGDVLVVAYPNEAASSVEQAMERTILRFDRPMYAFADDSDDGWTEWTLALSRAPAMVGPDPSRVESAVCGEKQPGTILTCELASNHLEDEHKHGPFVWARARWEEGGGVRDGRPDARDGRGEASRESCPGTNCGLPKFHGGACVTGTRRVERPEPEPVLAQSEVRMLRESLHSMVDLAVDLSRLVDIGRRALGMSVSEMAEITIARIDARAKEASAGVVDAVAPIVTPADVLAAIERKDILIVGARVHGPRGTELKVTFRAKDGRELEATGPIEDAAPTPPDRRARLEASQFIAALTEVLWKGSELGIASDAVLFWREELYRVVRPSSSDDETARAKVFYMVEQAREYASRRMIKTKSDWTTFLAGMKPPPPGSELEALLAREQGQ